MNEGHIEQEHQLISDEEAMAATRNMRAKLAASDEWDGFSGQAAMFEPGTRRVAALSQGRMYYTLPADWKIEDLRDAMAIIFSDHLIAYIGVLVLLTAMLSAVTVALLNQRPANR